MFYWAVNVRKEESTFPVYLYSSKLLRPEESFSALKYVVNTSGKSKSFLKL